MTHPDILKAERHGHTEEEKRYKIYCENCKTALILRSSDVVALSPDGKFCSVICACEYYDITQQALCNIML